MLAKELFYKEYDNIGKWLIGLFVDELKGQGHHLTGALARSMSVKVVEVLDKIEMQISLLDYGLDLNDGIPGGQIKLSAKFLSDLQKWVKRRKIGLSKDIQKTAYRIGRKMQKYGMPIPYNRRTPEGRRASKNGRVRGWMNYILKEYEKDIDFAVETITEQFVEGLYDEALKRVAKKYSFVYA